MLKVGVLVSGGGTNLQAIIDAIAAGTIKDAQISVVISNFEGVYALERAKNAGIKTQVVSKKGCCIGSDWEFRLAQAIKESGAELIVLAGFMSILSEDFVKKFEGKIINVHPSLIPSFCGEGFYGLKVHEAALKKGVKVTGATVHYVNSEVDGGEIILQKAVEVRKGDTPEALQKRVMEQAEWVILPQAIQLIAEKEQAAAYMESTSCKLQY
ncbi:MAG: phosphoribosylglycinamide formyltransferase [Oscillospiraceae bacterium]